jgi:phosphoglycerol transferase
MRLFVAYAVAAVLIGLKIWIDHTFGEPSIDQLLYLVQYAEPAAIKMSGVYVLTFLVEVIAFPVLAATALTALHMFAGRSWPHLGRHFALRSVPAAALVGGAVMLPMQFSAYSYLYDSFGEDQFSHEYVPPHTVAIRAPAPGKQRNLVLIYMESIEDTYSNTALFGRDLLAPLRELEGRSFDAYEKAPGTTWTIAAMVATQCGVPLRVYSEANVRPHPSGRTFLAGATCLGDILRAHGYVNVFMGGASLSFSGKGTFLRNHGYTTAFGREEWEALAAPPEAFNSWGMYDGSVFRRAREELKQLHDSGRPFNLTLLTMNTHNPYGYFGIGCPEALANHDFELLVACSAKQVRSFIDDARAGGYLDDTLVVIVGDHLAVPNPAWSKLRQVQDRHIFNRFVGSSLPPADRPSVIPFDMLPTILEAMGFSVEGGRLGLGYAGFNHPGLLPPQDRVEAVTTAALRASSAYRELWEPANRDQPPRMRLTRDVVE